MTGFPSPPRNQARNKNNKGISCPNLMCGYVKTKCWTKCSKTREHYYKHLNESYTHTHTHPGSYAPSPDVPIICLERCWNMDNNLSTILTDCYPQEEIWAWWNSIYKQICVWRKPIKIHDAWFTTWEWKQQNWTELFIPQESKTLLLCFFVRVICVVFLLGLGLLFLLLFGLLLFLFAFVLQFLAWGTADWCVPARAVLGVIYNKYIYIYINKSYKRFKRARFIHHDFADKNHM